MALMGLEEFQERQGQRETEVSTASLGFPERKVTGESKDPQVLLDLQEMMATGVKTARLDRGEWLERAVLVVYSAPEAPLVLPASVDFLELTGRLVPKETWVRKESRDLLDNRAFLVHTVLLVLKVRSGLQVKKGLKVNKVWLALPVPMAPLVTQEKKVLQARKEQLVFLAQWDQLATLDPAV